MTTNQITFLNNIAFGTFVLIAIAIFIIAAIIACNLFLKEKRDYKLVNSYFSLLRKMLVGFMFVCIVFYKVQTNVVLPHFLERQNDLVSQYKTGEKDIKKEADIFKKDLNKILGKNDRVFDTIENQNELIIIHFGK